MNTLPPKIAQASRKAGAHYALRLSSVGIFCLTRIKMELLDMSSGSILHCSKNFFNFFAIYS